MNTSTANPTQFPTNPDATQANQPRATSSTGTTTNSQVGTEMMGRMVQNAHQTIDRLADQAAPHVQRIEDKLVSADEKLHERADQLKDVSEGYVRSLREGVRENPLAAVGLALVLGMVISRITR